MKERRKKLKREIEGKEGKKERRKKERKLDKKKASNHNITVSPFNFSLGLH